MASYCSAIYSDCFFKFQIEKALNVVANKSSGIKNTKASMKANENKSDSNQMNNKNPSLKGVSQSLIDKVYEN